MEESARAQETCGPMLAREWSALLILLVLPKLGISWMGEPKGLTG